MIDPENTVQQFSLTPWDAHGIASLEATGADARSALESGLRAVLGVAVEHVLPPANPGRSAPIRGEGDGLANLFADMVDDLLEQVEYFGNGLRDIVVDGVLRREGGGYIGWGYATGTLEPAPPPR